MMKLMAFDVESVTKMMPIIGIVLIIIFGFLCALSIKSALKRKGIFKIYSKEPLEAHLQDPLNFNKLDKAKSFDTNTYFAKELMDYAEQLGINTVNKRDRYTKEGEMTPMLKTSINQNKANMVQAFTNNGLCMSDGYCDFIVNYRPHYMVCDFPKTINEYMAFCVNPGMFQKVDRSAMNVPSEEQKPEQSDVVNVKTLSSAFIDESQNVNIDSYEDDYVEPYDEGMSFADEETTVTPFRGSVSIGRDITMALANYAEKLAKKACSKKNIPSEINGVRTQDFDKECSTNYNRLSSIFLNGNYFKTDFVMWANSEYPNYGTERFDELIAPYLKYIKRR